MDLIGKTIGTQRFFCYIAVSAIEGCPLSEISLYQSLQALPQEVIDVTETENECKIQPDKLWHELGKQKDVNGKKKIGLLSLIARLF